MTYLTPKEQLDEIEPRPYWDHTRPRLQLDRVNGDIFEQALRDALEAESERRRTGVAVGNPFDVLARELAQVDYARRESARANLAKRALDLVGRAIAAAISGGAPEPGSKCVTPKCGRESGYREQGVWHRTHNPYKAVQLVDGKPYCKRHGDSVRGSIVADREQELLGDLRNEGFGRAKHEPERVQALVEKVAMLLATETYGSVELSTQLFAAIDEYAAKWGDLTVEGGAS